MSVSILQQERQACGTLDSECSFKEEAFAFPMTDDPLTIATPDGTLWHGCRSILRNTLFEESNALTDTTLTNARWLVDGMATMWALKPKNSYLEWLQVLVFNFIQPPKGSNPLRVEILNDTYVERSNKEGVREIRREMFQRIHIEGFEHKLPSLTTSTTKMT